MVIMLMRAKMMLMRITMTAAAMMGIASEVSTAMMIQVLEEVISDKPGMVDDRSG